MPGGRRRYHYFYWDWRRLLTAQHCSYLTLSDLAWDLCKLLLPTKLIEAAGLVKDILHCMQLSCPCLQFLSRRPLWDHCETILGARRYINPVIITDYQYVLTVTMLRSSDCRLQAAGQIVSAWWLECEEMWEYMCSCVEVKSCQGQGCQWWQSCRWCQLYQVFQWWQSCQWTQRCQLFLENIYLTIILIL